MAAPLTVVADAPSLSDRFGLLGSLIAANFGQQWRVDPLPGQQKPAQISWSEKDGFGISRAEMPPLRLQSRPIEGRPATKYYVYSASEETQLDRGDLGPMRVGPGELLILSNALRTRWTMPNSYVCMNAVINGDVFRQYVQEPDRVLGRKFRFPYGLNSVLLGLMNSAWAMALDGRFEHDSSCLVRTFLETLAFALDARKDPAPDQESTLGIRREQVKQYIQRNFRSEALTIEAIARHFGISTRYVQLAFAGGDQSPIEYLRQVRLSAAAATLRDPARVDVCITRIAYDCGFGSSAYFATEFKRRYGMTPRAFRAAALQADAEGFTPPATDAAPAPLRPRPRPSPDAAE